MDIKRKQEDRFKFLLSSYRYTNDGQPNWWADGAEIGKGLGFDKDYSKQIYNYLMQDGLIKPMGAGLRLTLTLEGVKQIEQAFEQPDKPTQYFQPINQYLINIETMSGGAIQQATSKSTINYCLTDEAMLSLKGFVDDLKIKLKELQLEPSLKAELDAEIVTLETQVKSPKPKKEIVAPTMVSIKAILEGIIAGLTVSAATGDLNALISKAELLINILTQ